ncbi:MAG: hypothetical protein WD994_02640 [Pseudomonadales bacterium]
MKADGRICREKLPRIASYLPDTKAFPGIFQLKTCLGNCIPQFIGSLPVPVFSGSLTVFCQLDDIPWDVEPGECPGDIQVVVDTLEKTLAIGFSDFVSTAI